MCPLGCPTASARIRDVGLAAGWAYMVCATLAWNLSRWFALILPDRGRWKEKHEAEKVDVLRMNFTTFVNAFMLIPAQDVRAARHVAG